MSATDELRRMLDERGVPYETNDDMGASETRWNGFTAYQLTPNAKLVMHPTPEQAIAATLGNSRADYHGYEQAAIEAWESIKAWNSRAERTCEFISSKGSDYPPVCSACGYELGIYDCEWFEDGTYGYGGNYCPNCGCKVVGE